MKNLHEAPGGGLLLRFVPRISLFVAMLLVLTMSLLSACSGGVGEGVNPEQVGLDFGKALLSGDTAKAKTYWQAGNATVDQHFETAATVLGQYETENLVTGSLREWSYTGQGDKRLEMRFDFRPRGQTGQAFGTGMIAVRMKTVNSKWLVADVMLVQPMK